MIGVLTGTGTYGLDGREDGWAETVRTPFGPVEVGRGRVAGVEVAHVARHGAGHRRLSHQVAHRANMAALAALGVRAVVATTICGALDPEHALGTLVVFDDLFFPSNRLPDGGPCTLFAEPGAPGRGHWIMDRPFAPGVRAALLGGARAAGRAAIDGGVYGHVDGPRLNTAPEIRALVAAGVTAVSQTGGPETVLAGEAGIPFALLGYLTDHANGVRPDPTPPGELARLMGESREAFRAVLDAALPVLADGPGDAAGVVFRLG